MKMKKVDAIVRQKVQTTDEQLARRSARIIRNVENAIAYAEDRIDVCKDKVENELKNLGNTIGAEMCSSVLNLYIQNVKELNEWTDSLNILKALKKELNEVVEVTEEQK